MQKYTNNSTDQWWHQLEQNLIQHGCHKETLSFTKFYFEKQENDFTHCISFDSTSIIYSRSAIGTPFEPKLRLYAPVEVWQYMNMLQIVGALLTTNTPVYA